MTIFKVLYIDDNAGTEENNCSSFVTSLSQNKLLDIKVIAPNRLEEFIETLVSKYSDYNAFILDLRLNENQEGDEVANYLGQVLAQAIRTEQTIKDRRLVEFPLFLLTSDTKLQEYYNTDISSHDLFDHYFFKDNLAVKGGNYEKQIVSIIKSYEKIKNSFEESEKKYQLNYLLDCEEYEIDIFNLNIDTMMSISEISQFILKQIVLRSGVLINEKVLASRLGVDIEKSQEDWESFKTILIEQSINYKGILSNGWLRWWGHRLIEWWDNIFSKPLISLNAEERVSLLKEKFNLNNLVSAQPIEKNLSTQFWTICQVYKLPLDTSNGFLVNKNYELWQDKEYVSLKSIIERKSVEEGIKLHPSEKERLAVEKSNYKANN